MPEVRLVVLALQDRLAYGPTFKSAMKALFLRRSLFFKRRSCPRRAGRSASATTKPTEDLKTLVSGAAKDLADYQRLTAAGQKFFASGQGIVTELWLECELSTKSGVTAVTT